MRVAILGGLLTAACVVAVACGGGAQKSPVRPEARGADAAPVMGPMPDRRDIEELDRQIRINLERMGVPPPQPAMSPSCASADCATEMAGGNTPHSSDASCKPAPIETCKESCTIADSICSNAKRICELAAQLEGDAWAAGKCSDGTASCSAAKQRCCGCQL